MGIRLLEFEYFKYYFDILTVQVEKSMYLSMSKVRIDNIWVKQDSTTGVQNN